MSSPHHRTDSAQKDYLLHTDNLDRAWLTGHSIKKWLCERTMQISQLSAEQQDPNISIVIRTRNDGQHIRRLFEDIAAQIFDGSVEIIVVDTDSRDDTVAYATSQGAKIINLPQGHFSYPHALNLGFDAARHPWVVTLVGHSSLSSRYFLRSLTYWSKYQALGGLYGVPLPNWNASILERLESVIWPMLWKTPHTITKRSIGIMGANSSIVRRSAWEELGGYDKRFAAGGEDVALAQAMLSRKYVIMREPLCSVFHSHGLSAKNNLKQWKHWIEVGKTPQPFHTDKTHRRRPDLR